MAYLQYSKYDKIFASGTDSRNRTIPALGIPVNPRLKRYSCYLQNINYFYLMGISVNSRLKQ